MCWTIGRIMCRASVFPPRGKRVVGDIEQELARFPIDQNTFIVIVTRGHNHDGKALAAVIDSPAKYIGMIGSKRKIKAIYDELTAAGTTIEKLLACTLRSAMTWRGDGAGDRDQHRRAVGRRPTRATRQASEADEDR